MRSFLTVAVAVVATAAGCGGQRGKGSSEAAPAGVTAAATPAPAPEVPTNCDEPAAEAKAAREGEDAGDKTAALFALAECEQLRWGAMDLDKAAREAFEAKLAEIAGLYAEVVAGQVPKYVIGGHVRTGDLYSAAVGRAKRAGAAGSTPQYKAKAKESYENGLVAADTTDKETRLDLDISDWVKAGCKGLNKMGAQEKRFKVCSPWKDSWR